LASFHFDISSFISKWLRVASSCWKHLSIGFKALFVFLSFVGFNSSSSTALGWSIPVKLLYKVNIITELLIACNNIEKNQIKQSAKTNSRTKIQENISETSFFLNDCEFIDTSIQIFLYYWSSVNMFYIFLLLWLMCMISTWCLMCVPICLMCMWCNIIVRWTCLSL